MQLDLTETQSMMREGIAGLLARELSWERVRETRDGGGVDDALWSSLAAAGWLSLPFAGGVESPLLDASLLLAEVAKSGAIVPFLETIACSFVLAETAGDDQLDDVRRGVEAGTVTFAPAVAGAETAAVAAGVLSCVRRFVDFGQACTHHLVAATEDGEHLLFLVDATSDAVTFQPAHHIGRLPQATATYRAAVACRIGGPGAVARLRDIGTVLAAVELVAYGEVALGLTVGHVAERVQFGRPLGAFQAVQHQCADMATLLEAARFLVYETVWKLEHGQATATEIAVAKAAASRAGAFVTMQAHQLHGGIGMTEEYPLQFFSRRAQARAVAWMSQHEALLEVARTVDENERWV
jgi:alkylation response protein AidB-like acyl-CoA dehydrogenase